MRDDSAEPESLGSRLDSDLGLFFALLMGIGLFWWVIYGCIALGTVASQMD